MICRGGGGGGGGAWVGGGGRVRTRDAGGAEYVGWFWQGGRAGGERRHLQTSQVMRFDEVGYRCVAGPAGYADGLQQPGNSPGCGPFPQNEEQEKQHEPRQTFRTFREREVWCEQSRLHMGYLLWK